MNKAFYSTLGDLWFFGGGGHAKKWMQSWHRKALWTFTKCGICLGQKRARSLSMREIWMYKTLYKITCGGGGVSSGDAHDLHVASLWYMLMFTAHSLIHKFPVASFRYETGGKKDSIFRFNTAAVLTSCTCRVQPYPHARSACSGQLNGICAFWYHLHNTLHVTASNRSMSRFWWWGDDKIWFTHTLVPWPKVCSHLGLCWKCHF